MATRSNMLVRGGRTLTTYGEVYPGIPGVWGSPAMGGFSSLLPNEGIPTPQDPTITPMGAAPPWWVYLLGGGLQIANTLLQPTSSSQGPLALPPGATPVNAASVIAALAALGIRVIGSVIRTTRGLWARVPQAIKSAALAIGLTLAFDDDDEGNGVRKHRRGRGITGPQLRGFNRVVSLLRKVGMRPKALGYGRSRKCK